jgi:hypothetical protein
LTNPSSTEPSALIARIGGVFFPKKIHFVNPREDADVLVQYQDVELNPTLPDDAWTIA